MPKLNKKILLLFLVFVGFLPTIIAQKGQVKGIVQDETSKNPVVNATVRNIAGDLSTTTDENGMFSLENLPAGSLELVISAPEFQELNLDVEIKEGATTDLGVVNVKPVQKGDIAISEDRIPTISLSSSELDDDNQDTDISGLLTASRDVFVSTASFVFGPARFRIKGFDTENTMVHVNGVPFNDLENGRAYWSTWGGLNDVTRNRETNIGISAMSYGFGGIGGGTSLDLRASKQRKQVRASYAISNRSYANRVMLTYSTGMMANNWALTFSGSRRWAQEGYAEGTFYDAYAYFLSVEKKLNDNHSLGLVAFGAPIKRGKQGASVQEMYDLADDNYYNSYWGFQNGEKRNSRVANTHQPVVMLTHDWSIGEDATLTTSAVYQAGRNGGTALDWYEARDPRPDYYRRLPSFIQDETVSNRVEDLFRNDVNVRQIDWDNMYEVNRNNFTTIENADGIAGNTISGNRSNYIVEDRRYDNEKIYLNTLYQNIITDNLTINGGISYQHHTVKNFKTVEDLLGGDFYVDIDKFAERDFPDDPDAIQNDVENPNGIVREGDRHGYDYDSNIRRAGTWWQGVFSYSKVDFFLTGDVSRTQFWRTGNIRNGRFPDNSFGDSEKQTFTNYGGKAGLTYKINGRNYLYANAAYLTRAPFFRNVYLSPRTRDQIVSNLQSENIYSAEGGYLLRSPSLKGKMIFYYARFNDQTTIRNFYHDDLNSFVNFIMTDVDKEHMGTEIALEAKVSSTLTVSAVAAIGQYIFKSRPLATISQDNNAELLVVDETIYAKNFYVPGTPQTAYSLGLNYNSPKFWFVNLNFNYFDDSYLDFNPIRRTVNAVDGVEQGSDQWNDIIEQEKLEGAFTVDFFGGKSWKINDFFLRLNVGVSNILNNQDFITGGYEQLRYNNQDKDISTFPPKYYYGYGRTYFISLTFNMY